MIEARFNILDRRVTDLNRTISQTERRLIAIGSELDNIGEGGSGRLLYVIDRANMFVKEFERMYPTLEIEDVKGWISYEQFVLRGLLPTFDSIRSAGQRLIALRNRLQMIMNTIQTSALIIEATSTRENTTTLRKIATHFFHIKVALLPISLAVLATIIGIGLDFAEVVNLGQLLGVVQEATE